MENQKKTHVLLLPFPAQGHISPMVQFCKRLVATAQGGVRATIATTAFVANTKHYSSDNALIDFATISDGYDQTGTVEDGSSEAYLATFRVVGSRTLSDLIERLATVGRPVNALIFDGFMPWVADVADQFGLARAVFFTQSCAVSSIYYHAHKGLLPLPLSGATVRLPGLPPMDPRETPSYVYEYGSDPGFGKLVFEQFSNVDKADWIFFSSFHKLEEQVEEWMRKLWRARTIGPTLPSMYLDKRLEEDRDYGINFFKPNTTACMDWLRNKPPSSVVFASFGSWIAIQSEQTEEIAYALKESKFNFLWVLRESEQSKLPKSFKEELEPEKGILVNWSPQLEVLASESVGCFVTHCGFNSVLEAISLAVPVVAMPQCTDQGTSAKFVEEVWGVGLRAASDETGVVRRGVLGDRIREVMEGAKGREIRGNAVKWRDWAREAVDEGGTSDRNIREYVAELVGTSRV